LNEEIQALLAKAETFLASAEMLRARGDVDSAASRLYYAMFYCAEALLFDKGLTFSSHRGVMSGFGQHLVKTGELPAEMHDWLLKGFEKRHAGDYLAVSRLHDAEVRDLQAKAARFVEQTREYLSGRGLAESDPPKC
jgi:uncharacterized protein (UPF0332 family)